MTTMYEVREFILKEAKINSLVTDKDFEYLSENVNEKLCTRKTLNINTWKRIFGKIKVKAGHQFNDKTKKVVAQFLGFDTWDELEENMDTLSNRYKSPDKYKSGFISNRTTDLMMKSLRRADAVVVEYGPDRMIEAEYLGSNRFRVINAYNCDLHHNDEFTAYSFVNGDLFRIMNVKRGSEYLGDFTSARNHCIMKMHIKRFDKFMATLRA